METYFRNSVATEMIVSEHRKITSGQIILPVHPSVCWCTFIVYSPTIPNDTFYF